MGPLKSPRIDGRNYSACKPPNSRFQKTPLNNGLIGIGGNHWFRPSHTTRHAGPHRAVREVEVSRETRHTQPIEVGNGQHIMDGRATVVPPATTQSRHGFRNPGTRAQADQLLVDRLASPPLPEVEHSQATTYPLIQ